MLKAQVVVENKLDSAHILIGEQVHLTATVDADKGEQVVFPEYADGYILPGVEVLERSHIDTTQLGEGKRQRLTRIYTLTAFDSALHYLPPLEVTVGTKKYAAANRLGLKVSTIPVDTTQTADIRPPHAPVESRFVWTPYLLYLSLLLWLIVIGIFAAVIKLSDRRPQTRRIIITPPAPPHKQAMEAIERIKQTETPEDDKAYYIELTDILRTYIQERFHFNAKEMVSTEIIEHLRTVKDEEALRELKEVFATADLVKFAKHTTSLQENERNMLNVVEFVNTTKPQEEVKQQPMIKEVVVGEVRQKRIRTATIIATVVLSIAAAAVARNLLLETYQTYL